MYWRGNFQYDQKEITSFRVMNQTIDKFITIREASKILGLSELQVIRLIYSQTVQGFHNNFH